MENNTQNKAKFFAQYWGQNVLTRPKSDNKKWILGEDVSIHSALSKSGYDYQYFLELKPLSLITDEDMSNMANFYEKSATNIYIHDFQLTFDYYEGDETHSVAVDLDYGYCLDFLRNNGFATDWMGLSVDKLQEYGWIKLV